MKLVSEVNLSTGSHLGSQYAVCKTPLPVDPSCSCDRRGQDELCGWLKTAKGG